MAARYAQCTSSWARGHQLWHCCSWCYFSCSQASNPGLLPDIVASLREEVVHLGGVGFRAPTTQKSQS